MHPLPLVCGAGFSEASRRRSKSANIAGSFKNKVQSTMAQVTPDKVTAEMHRKLSEPGSASKVKDRDRDANP